MKSKMQWVRMQKRDLESRILEMKSTISSLKDEQRIIEVALEEKQAEINMLTEKLTETNREDSRAKLISESVQQKEAEIDIPVKIWSMSADDPSNPTNLTKAAGGETEVLRESVERDEQKNSTTENIPRNADQSALKRDEAVQGEDRGQAQDGEQESQELRTAQEDVPGDKNSTIFQTLDGKRKTIDSPKTGEIFLEEKRYDLENASMESINRSGQVQKQSKDAGVVNAADWKEHGTTIGGDQGNFEDSQGITRSLDRITRVQMNQD
ncbi:putative potassium transporter 5-like [Capsicum annuum]|nr:putative potassium transporter 5-like [Capsicum annuum]